MKVIVVSDLHGNTVWESIDPDKYDLIVFLGDYVDSWTRSNEQIYNNLLNVINFKKKYSDKVVLLWGNHDLAYVYLGNNKFSCSGHRPTMDHDLNKLFQENYSLFRMAHQVKDYLWTHAGMSKEYHDKVFIPLRSKMVERFPEMNDYNIAEMLNAIAMTSNVDILAQVGWQRGGNHAFGGPLWADKSEHIKATEHLPYYQITGHNEVPHYYTIPFGGSYGVTFADCLSTVTKFYEVEIA